MTMRPGALVCLDIERAAVGGRMIARDGGRVVLVRGAIPGERVEARIERVQRQVAFADTVRVLVPSPDRIPVPAGLASAGQLLAHVADPRQRLLKAEMIADALRRIGKIALDHPVEVLGGPSDGYRTRARAHVRGGAVGFYEDGTHHLCAIGPTRQLSAASVEILERVGRAVHDHARGIDAEIEWAENAAGTERAVHVTLADPRGLGPIGSLPPVDGVNGGSVSAAATSAPVRRLWGTPRVIDRLRVGAGEALVGHDARAFFQGNRYLLQPLVDEVVGRLDGPVVDLYAGVGLFAVGAAAAGHVVTAVEGEAIAAADLAANAVPWPNLTVVHAAVEAHLASARPALETAIVDPPRSGLSGEALAGVLAWRPARLVYVSCDPATLARDLRRCLDAGYRLERVRGVDLFPRTGHVEAVVTLVC
ncbi:MAG: class I SAM-dependent RNA methyltransferase [Vicinamibacterales bacterium]